MRLVRRPLPALSPQAPPGSGHAGQVRRSRIRATATFAAAVAVAGWSITSASPGPAASSKPSTSPSLSTTVAPPFTGRSGAAQVRAAVTASAKPVATTLGARLGKPSCPPVEKPRVGLTLQCLVAFDKSLLGWLVTLTPSGALDARPTFPVVSKRIVESQAGSGATCDMAAFVGLPVGATVSCRAGKATIEFAMTAEGSLQRR